jgi:hypothetical protein
MATAMDVRKKYPKASVLVLEKEQDLAQHRTGRNSGVIHSGIYYKPGSLKARFAVEGNHRMIRFCREHGIKHEVCGKVIAATKASEFPRLSAPRLRIEGWRSWRLQSEICFRFYRRTLMKATGANGPTHRDRPPPKLEELDRESRTRNGFVTRPESFSQPLPKQFTAIHSAPLKKS